MDRGQFATLDDALTEAWRSFQQRRETSRPESITIETSDPRLGSLREYADEMDEIVAEAMKRREEWKN